MNYRKFRFALVALLAAAMAMSLLVSPAIAGATGRAASAHTVQVNVKPTDSHGRLKPAYQVTRTFDRGQCFGASSEVVVGADRCFSGNFVLDPCWPTLNRHGRYSGSYCPRAAWLRRGVLVKSSHKAGEVTRGRSLWAVRLGSGLRCSYLSGASSIFRGRRVNFGCAPNRRKFLVGEPSRRTAFWRITEVTFANGHFRNPRRVVITTAWFGVSPSGR